MRPACISLLVIAAVLAACSRSPPELVLSGPTMGTTYTVKIARANADPYVTHSAIELVLQTVDLEASSYRTDSAVAKFNGLNSVEWTDTPVELAEVVDRALEVSRASGGAFDITVAPLVAVWGFGPSGRQAAIPEPATLASVREHVGHQKLQVRRTPPALKKDDPALTIDLNGIAPGYGVDRIAHSLAQLGLNDFMIDIGGEIRAQGHNAKGEPWRIAIERPKEGAQTPYAIVALTDMSISTSGEYRDYYERDGHRYSHTIDPRTGRPIEHDLAAVSVIAATTADADAWATALNVLGPKDGYALATKRGLTAMFILKEGEKLVSRMTGEFERYLAVSPDGA